MTDLPTRVPGEALAARSARKAQPEPEWTASSLCWSDMCHMCASQTCCCGCHTRPRKPLRVYPETRP